ncbi:PAAR domain-containing protein [Pseudomonas huanghezhanensis]|uniref:PAAR domain-containing protein n=1 Tax=Pseudomonas huanghezhanensis TaxID=3002903 RepID=UPI002285EDC3|nr:PAAR domain-containing protein [Pseudomonas sp. BSw22131]
MRSIILLGDPTSAGGQVVQGSSCTFIENLAVARVGDAVVCIHGPCVIASGDPTTLDEDRPVARAGDLTACGSVLIATHFASVIF